METIGGGGGARRALFLRENESWGGVGGSDKSRSRRSGAVGINLEKVKVVKIYFERSCFRVIALLKICSSNVYVVAQLLRSIRFSRNLHPTFRPLPPLRHNYFGLLLRFEGTRYRGNSSELTLFATWTIKFCPSLVPRTRSFEEAMRAFAPSRSVARPGRGPPSVAASPFKLGNLENVTYS